MEYDPVNHRRVSKADGSQVLDLQRDARLAVMNSPIKKLLRQSSPSPGATSR
jgi:hypothetical protein